MSDQPYDEEPLLIDIQRLSRLLSLSRRTIERMLSKAGIPPPIRIAGKRLWRVEDIQNWIDEQRA